MFEKEAEEYLKTNNLEWELECHRTSPIGEVKQAYQKGAEFGYNKANEWHYVKDGDLPKESGRYLVYVGGGGMCYRKDKEQLTKAKEIIENLGFKVKNKGSVFAPNTQL